MKLDPQACIKLLQTSNPVRLYGKVNKVVGLVAEGSGLRAPLGAVCHMLPDGGDEGIAAEVVGFRDGNLLFMPYGDMRGIRPGSRIRNTSLPPVFPAGPGLLGRAFDAFGTPLDAGPPISAELYSSPLPMGDNAKADFARQVQEQEPYVPEWAAVARQQWHPELVPIYADPPSPLQRPRITDILDVGVRSVNSLLTLGKGQRVGIMAGSGVGKSTLMGMMARYTHADVNVIALIGERGREVLEFMQKDLGEEGMARSVLVVATSDQPAMLRKQCPSVATGIAEYFRDQGLDVLLMMDSLTRFAMAQREIGLAVGEPPVSRGYTPSIYAELPKLLERSGNFQKGSITGVYTVLVEGDDTNEPIADTVRGILDGHIVLSRRLANSSHFPAIDIGASISRLMADIVSDEHKKLAARIRDILGTYEKNADLVSIGAYKAGTNPKLDMALSKIDGIQSFLRQGVDEAFTYEEDLNMMRKLL